MTGGLVLAAMGFGVFTQLDASSGFGAIVIGSVIFSLGSSPVFTLTNDLIIGTAPPERAGAAAGLSETSAEFGGALGIAIFGSIGVAIYRGAMAAAIPTGVSLEAGDTARDTLGGAIEVAAQLPDRVAASLTTAAGEAFLQGMHIGAVISAIGALALAFLVMTTLRHVRPSSESEDQSSGEFQETSKKGTHVENTLEPARAEC
jgi:DHA2 family multidrug resistance protein-like MFS transporter